MTTYIIRRLIHLVIVLLIVSVLVFTAMRFLPGDPIRLVLTMSQQGQVTEEQVAKLRHEAGLDKPILEQYYEWIKGIILRGDLGDSILYKVPVKDEIFKRIPVTLHIGLLAFIIGIIIGVPAGIMCTVRRGTWIDMVITTLANIGITVPVFWLGLILIYIFGLNLKWLPVQGYTSPFTDFWLSTKQIIMPVACLALFPIASTARQTRSAMLDVMSQDYIRTAWSKGVKERVVIMRHALKNGLIPVVTLSGVGLSVIIGGAVFEEYVFNIPGLGRLAVSSVNNQDYTYVQGIVLIIAAMVLVINLLVDLSYGWLDPRIRYN